VETSREFQRESSQAMAAKSTRSTKNQIPVFAFLVLFVANLYRVIF